jgi:hypothetical protein
MAVSSAVQARRARQEICGHVFNSAARIIALLMDVS